MRTLTRYMRQLIRNGAHWRTVIYQPRLMAISNPVNNVLSLPRRYGGISVAQLASTILNNKLLRSIKVKLKKGTPIPQADIEEAIIEIQNSGKIETLDAFILIKSCGKYLIDLDSKESIQLVQDIWDTLNSLDVKIDVSHYNALLGVYLEKDFDFSPNQFLSTMIEKLIEPNRVTFQQLLAASCKKGDIAEALKLIDKIKNRGLTLTEDTFNLLIQGYGEAGDIENALNILEIMEKKGINPSTDTEAALMCAYAKLGDVKSLNDSFEKLKANDIQLCDIHYLDILLILVANGHGKQAEELMAKMPREIHSDVDVSLAVVKIIKMEHPELAVKLLTSTTANSDRLRARSSVILRSLVKTRSEVEVVIRVCELMKDQAFQCAVYYYLIDGANPSVSLKILKAWFDAGGEIRDHFFWPILVSEGKANNADGVVSVVKSMIDEFKISPSLRTLRDFTIPFMCGSRKEIVAKLKEINISKEEVVIAIVDRLLIERKSRSAAILMTINSMTYPKDVFLRHLAEILNAKDDVKSFVVILRLLYHYSEENSRVYTAEILREAMMVVPDYRPGIMINLLQELKVAGLSISKKVAGEIREYLGSNVTPEVDEVINLLQSGQLSEMPMSEYNPYLLHKFKGTEEPVSTASRVGELRNIFGEYYQKKDFEHVVAIFKELYKTGYISAPVIAQTIISYCELEDVEEAEKHVEIFYDKIPHLNLNLGIVFKFAELLVKKNRFQDAIIFLSKQNDVNERESLSQGTVTVVESILKTTANLDYDLEDTFKLYEILSSKKLIRNNFFPLGVLIETFLNRQDYGKALEVFERAVTQYKCSPYKMKLLKSLIQNDSDNKVYLTRYSEICNKAFGNNDTKLNKAFVYISIGKYQLARKLFESLRISKIRVESFVGSLEEANNLEAIEEFIKMTRHSSMDRIYLYTKSLEIYAKHNDWQRGLDLWLQMQEEEITPQRKFLTNLKNLLEANKQPVPFVCEQSFLSKLEFPD